MESKRLSQKQRIMQILLHAQGCWVPLYNELREEWPPIAQYQARLLELREEVKREGKYKIEGVWSDKDGCNVYRLLRKEPAQRTLF